MPLSWRILWRRDWPEQNTLRALRILLTFESCVFDGNTKGDILVRMGQM